jgi:hypothetical protein
MTYFLAALAASGFVIAAGWRSRRARGLAVVRDRNEIPNDPLWGDPEIDAGASESPADVGAAIRLALKRMAPVITAQSVKVDVAAPSGLLGRMRGAALADLLEELLTAAIHGAPAGRLLLTAAAHGDRIHVGVTDDVPGADPAVRAAGIRGMKDRVALRGGSLDINVRPAEGTTVTLRFAAADKAWQDRAAGHASKTPPEPASREAGIRTTGALPL